MWSKDLKAVIEFLHFVLGQKSILNIRGLATSFIKNNLAKKWLDKNCVRGPFFILVHYSAHWPYEPPEPFFSRFLDCSLKRELRSVRRDVYDLISGQDLGKKMEVLKSLYDAQIAYLDTCVKDLIDHLKSLDMFENTLLIITSDHGDLLGEHGLLHHEFVLYEPLIKVPFIIRFPDLFRKGEKYSGLVQTLDILPTLDDYLGIEWTDVSREIQGKSLLKLIENKEEREFTISERSDWSPATSIGKIAHLEKRYPSFEWRKYAHEIVALRTDEYKYIWSSEGRDELYDLRYDPQESNNLVLIDKGKVSELGAKMEAWKRSFVRAEPSAERRDLKSSVKKRLKALGYI